MAAHPADIETRAEGIELDERTIEYLLYRLPEAPEEVSYPVVNPEDTVYLQGPGWDMQLRRTVAGRLVYFPSEWEGPREIVEHELRALDEGEAGDEIEEEDEVKDKVKIKEEDAVKGEVKIKEEERRSGAKSPQQPLTIAEGSNDYLVDQLVDRRVKPGRRRKGSGRSFQYLVKWAEWGPEHNEWVDEDQVAKGLIRDFKYRHGLQILAGDYESDEDH